MKGEPDHRHGKRRAHHDRSKTEEHAEKRTTGDRFASLVGSALFVRTSW